MENEIKTKKCSKCQNLKSIDEFGVDTKIKDGLKRYCKVCRKNESDKEKDKKRKQDWYLKNKELKEHITSLFTDGMSWDNYGEWHIDHIKPLTLFDDNTPIHVVNALSNLQPLWATTREINGVIYEGNLNKLNFY
jgi:hypothetical protein